MKIILLLLTLFACVLGVQATPTAPDPAYAQITDDPQLPSVLLLGDSVSVGYTLAVRKELYDRTLQYHMIDPLELWGYALAMFKIAKGDVRLSAIGGTNIGRDSDTIAGRAAMLAGTLQGAGNVPAEWTAMFPPHALARIKRNAGLFADFIATRKLPRLQRRQQGVTG